jgi:hypothetical protein
MSHISTGELGADDVMGICCFSAEHVQFVLIRDVLEPNCSRVVPRVRKDQNLKCLPRLKLQTLFVFLKLR